LSTKLNGWINNTRHLLLINEYLKN